MRLFKFRKFQKWAKDENILDTTLIQALRELEQGLFDANLGGGLYKKRVARVGQGKSRGYRVLLAFHENNRCILFSALSKARYRILMMKRNKHYDT